MRIKLIILFVFIVSLLRSQDTIYIDPSYGAGGNGTLAQPYDAWTDFTFTNGNTYLQKCGTTYTIGTQVYVDNKSHITLGSYGTGAKPIIHKALGTGNIIRVQRSQTIVIDGFELVGDVDATSPTGTWNAVGIDGSGHNSSPTAVNHDLQIKNCDIHRGYNGIRIIRANNTWNWSADSILIENCNIYDIDEDGIFVSYTTYIDIIGCHFWDINMNWFKADPENGIYFQAPGDAIQLTWGTTHWKIKNNIVDRRTTAGKFGIIVSNNPATTTSEYVGEIIGNIIYTPKDTVPRWTDVPGEDDDQVGGSGVYLEGEYDVTIAYNKFIGRGFPPGERGQAALYIQNNQTINCYYNIFDSTAPGSTIHDINTRLNFNNNTIISGHENDTMTISTPPYWSAINYMQNISDVVAGGGSTARNNIVAGNVTGYGGKAFRITTANVTQSNNLDKIGNDETWDSYFGITDWEDSDFHLTAGSIAIDAGYNTGYDYDYDSVPVPQNLVYDIGALEYNAGVPPVGDPPVANFSANDVSPYIGQTITFTDLSTESPNEWLWAFNPITVTYVGGTTSASQNPQVQFTASGSYNVTLTATNAEGSDSEVKTGYIVVAAAGVAQFSASDVVTEIDTKIDFTDESSGTPLTWLWTFNPTTVTYLNATTSASQNPDVEFDATGLYDVTLYITFAGGNDSEIKLDYINVLAAPTADFYASATTPYAEDIVLFTDLSTEKPTAWLWTFSPTTVTYENGTGNASQNTQVSFDAAGLYTVTLRATNAYGNDTESKVDYINVKEIVVNLPVADFVASIRTINETQSITYYNLTSFDSRMQVSELDDFTYSWTFEGGTPSTSTETNPIVTYNSAGIYDVTLVSTNDGNSDTEIKSNYVIVYDENTPFKGSVLSDGTNILIYDGKPVKY